MNFTLGNIFKYAKIIINKYIMSLNCKNNIKRISTINKRIKNQQWIKERKI